jgi:hypothetical protein
VPRGARQRRWAGAHEFSAPEKVVGLDGWTPVMVTLRRIVDEFREDRAS